jgi:hypothetical protein
MSESAIIQSGIELLDRPGAFPPDRNPYRVYLSRLAAGSRPTMAEALETVARIASGGTVPADSFPWHALRYQHVQAIRSALMGTVSERTGRPLEPGQRQQGTQRTSGRS